MDNVLNINTVFITECVPNAVKMELVMKNETERLALEWSVKFLNSLGVVLGITDSNLNKLKAKDYTDILDESTNT